MPKASLRGGLDFAQQIISAVRNKQFPVQKK